MSSAAGSPRAAEQPQASELLGTAPTDVPDARVPAQRVRGISRSRPDAGAVEGISARLRESVGALPIARVAELTGFHPEAVRRYLSGARPPLWFVRTFCGVMNVNAHWLLCGEGEARSTSERLAALATVPTERLARAIAERVRAATPAA